MTRKTLLLSETDVNQCITMKEVFNIVEKTFSAHGNNQVIMPAKITLDIKEIGINSWINAMPGYISTTNTMGIKWAGGFTDNFKKGLPYVMATIILNDSESGQVISIMNGVNISNMRTGCAAAVTAKYTARKDSSKVAFIGAGMQARMTLEALTYCFDITEVRASDINASTLETFKLDMQNKTGIKVIASPDNKTAVEGADIIITATQADEALVHDNWIISGATAISLGSYQEFAEKFINSADKIIVDSLEQCTHRGELKKPFEKGLITEKNITAELGEVVAGKKIGRSLDSERILAVPIGLGTLDLAVAHEVLQCAMGKKIGVEYSFYQ